jgi:hypothetical protein
MAVHSGVARQAHADEDEALTTDVRQRLRHQFEDIPEEELDVRVRASFARFAAVRIRDYLPVLVEKEVRADLIAARRQPDTHGSGHG